MWVRMAHQLFLQVRQLDRIRCSRWLRKRHVGLEGLGHPVAASVRPLRHGLAMHRQIYDAASSFILVPFTKANIGIKGLVDSFECSDCLASGIWSIQAMVVRFNIHLGLSRSLSWHFRRRHVQSRNIDWVVYLGCPVSSFWANRVLVAHFIHIGLGQQDLHETTRWRQGLLHARMLF